MNCESASSCAAAVRGTAAIASDPAVISISSSPARRLSEVGANSHPGGGSRTGREATVDLLLCPAMTSRLGAERVPEDSTVHLSSAPPASGGGWTGRRDCIPPSRRVGPAHPGPPFRSPGRRGRHPAARVCLRGDRGRLVGSRPADQAGDTGRARARRLAPNTRLMTGTKAVAKPAWAATIRTRSRPGRLRKRPGTSHTNIPSPPTAEMSTCTVPPAGSDWTSSGMPSQPPADAPPDPPETPPIVEPAGEDRGAALGEARSVGVALGVGGTIVGRDTGGAGADHDQVIFAGGFHAGIPVS